MYQTDRLTYKEYGKITVSHEKLDGSICYDVYESEEEYKKELEKEKEIKDMFNSLKNVYFNM